MKVDLEHWSNNGLRKSIVFFCAIPSSEHQKTIKAERKLSLIRDLLFFLNRSFLRGRFYKLLGCDKSNHISKWPNGIGRLHYIKEAFLLSTQQPGFKSRHRQYYFSLLLSWWTVLRSSPSSAKQWISPMQLAVTSRAMYYKK